MYLLRIRPAGITGNVQGNNTNYRHPIKTYYKAVEMELMLESRHNLESITLLFRDGMMKMFVHRGQRDALILTPQVHVRKIREP